MPAHLIERDHDGPKLLQTFETREEADEAREELIGLNPEMARTTSILIVPAINASRRHVG